MARDVDALTAFLAERSCMPVDWTSNDCVRHAAAAVAAQFGTDPLRGVPRWRSATGAMRVLTRMGGMEAAVSARLTPIAPAMAMRGDIAGVVCPKFGLLLMVVEGMTLVGPGETGHVRAPRRAMAMAWSAEP
ncbi:DUF6950 family protein [Stakelama tenebrarum]|uniref:DUF6950 domain-containing protein n=1 Tax=Stakelama tenebrarum TaxID=2711215 RepID=A0A6G6Y4W4_9SPHN|nr:hypothetical protein [Sphingosinithalassobacter tenebrarum]QIG79994.1 hypothetical protein G5C33_09540 [Sphingosinithalassobacter tenebrarum]